MKIEYDGDNVKITLPNLTDSSLKKIENLLHEKQVRPYIVADNNVLIIVSKNKRDEIMASLRPLVERKDPIESIPTMSDDEMAQEMEKDRVNLEEKVRSEANRSLPKVA